MKKQFIILSLLSFTLLGCKNIDNNPSQIQDNILHNITLLQCDNGEITCDKQEAKNGEIVQLNIQPNVGYYLSEGSLKVNDTFINNDSFIMPNYDVTISALFEASGDLIDVEESNLIIESNDNVKAKFYTKYEDNHFNLSAIVEDNDLSKNEKTEIYFNIFNSDNVLMFSMNSVGENHLYKVNKSNTIEETSGFKSEFSYFKINEYLGGYKFSLNLSYDILGNFNKNDDYITLCPVIYSSSNSNAVIDNVYNKCDKNDPNTYLLVVDNNEYEENPNNCFNYQLGFLNSVDQNIYWDLSSDYSRFDKNYDNRIVTLSESNQNDNILNFYKIQSEVSYTEMSVLLTDVYKNEKYGKYGLKYVDSTGNGIFFFMDTPGTNISSMTNKCNAGYALIKNNSYDFNTHVKLLYDYIPANNEKIKLSVYQNENHFQFALNDILICDIDNVSLNGITCPTIVSFNLGLEITNYYSTKDINEVNNHLLEKRSDAYFANAGNTLVNGIYWDLTNSNNNQKGPVYLTNHDGLDNNLIFNEEGTNFLYSKASFKVVDYYNKGDRWMKFGLALYDGTNLNKDELFYYVDASAKSPANDISNIDGNKFGYSLRKNKQWVSWNILDSTNRFDLNTKIVKMEMIYLKQAVYLYADEKFVGKVDYTLTSDRLFMGIKSFGLGIEVFDYYCTSNKNDSNISDYVKRNNYYGYFIGSTLTNGVNNTSFVNMLSDDINGLFVNDSSKNASIISYVDKIKNIPSTQKIDSLILELPIIDAINNTNIGTISSLDTKDYDLNTIIGSLEEIISYSKDTWNCDLIIYTNPYCNNQTYETYIESIKELQNKWDVLILDFYNYNNMTKLDDDVLNSYIIDQYYLNEDGHKWMNYVFTKYLKSLYNLTHVSGII